MIELLTSVLGGLGLFFIGIKAIGGNLQQLAGNRARAAIMRLTSNRISSALLGIVLGGLTQSTNAVTFIATSTVKAGLLPVGRALPVLIWANSGTAALVLLASIDMRAAALWLLGVTGIAAYFGWDGRGKLRPLVNALTGLGMLFLGLAILKGGAQPLRGFTEVQDALRLVGDGLLIPFLAGVLVTFVVQSSSTVSILTIAFGSAGLLSYDQTVLIVYGASLGSGLSVLLLAKDFSGTARQLILFQVAFKAAGTLLFLLLFLVEHELGVPLVLALCERLADDDAHKLGWLFLILQVGTGLAITPISDPLMRLVERFSPKQASEDLAKPAFIHDRARQDPPSALNLAEKEAARLIERLPSLIEEVVDTGSRPAIGRAVMSDASEAVERELGTFLRTLLGDALERAQLDRAVTLNARLSLIANLRETLDAFAEACRQGFAGGTRPPVLHAIAESLHMLLCQLQDASTGDDAEEVALLLDLTADRSQMMHAMRTRIAATDTGSDPAGYEALFRATGLFERAVWLIRQINLQFADLSRKEPVVLAGE